VRRDVQLSLVEGMDRPVGPVIQSVFEGRHNAELLAAVAPLYLTGSVLDVTYGYGGWWERFQPEPFAWHDLKADGVDCRELPEEASSWDTVCFDPPYVEAGTPGWAGHARFGGAHRGGDFFDRFGLGTSGVLALLADGTMEACRVARRFVLVKCMEFVSGGKFKDGPTVATLAAADAGWHLHDRIVHYSGGGIGGSHRTYTVLRAARAHSYLLVFAP
jgi:opacity protein-like surface antigen